MTFNLGIPEISVFVVLIGILQFLLSLWISERLKTSLQWETKVRGQAANVAEYMTMARLLRENSPKVDYIKANRLAWELAIWLPEKNISQNGQSTNKSKQIR